MSNCCFCNVSMKFDESRVHVAMAMCDKCKASIYRQCGGLMPTSFLREMQSEDEGYFTVDDFYTIDFECTNAVPTIEQVMKLAEVHGITASFCQHEHDCCGHWYANAPTIMKLVISMEDHKCQVVFRQHTYKNI